MSATPNDAQQPANRWRKKPVVIAAVQFTPANEKVLLAHLDGCTGWHMADGETVAIIIPTLEGEMRAERGDWIIRGVKGEFYPCKPDIFAATYEPAAGTDNSAQRPDDGATREAHETVNGMVRDDAPVMIAWERYKASTGYANAKHWAVRPDATEGSLWAAFAEGFGAALSQRPRAETPTDDKRDAARWRKVRPFLTTVGEDVAYLSVFEDAPSSHPGATIEDIVDALEEWERPESTAPRVPEAGSAPLPFSVLDGGDWVYDSTKHELRIGHLKASPERWIEAIRRVVAWPDVPQPSASTTGETDRE